MVTKAPFPENESGAVKGGTGVPPVKITRKMRVPDSVKQIHPLGEWHGRPARENHAQDARATTWPREMCARLLARPFARQIFR